GPPQLSVLTLELLEPCSLVRRQAGPPAVVPLGLPHPMAECLRRTADLLGDRGDRRPLRRVVLGVLEHHPDGTLPHFRREPTWSGEGCHAVKEWSLRKTRRGSCFHRFPHPHLSLVGVYGLGARIILGLRPVIHPPRSRLTPRSHAA